MAGRIKNNRLFEEWLKQMIDSIDARESTEWADKTRAVSENIRRALLGQMQTLREACGTRFLDYCNTIKALLAIYNFGNLESEDTAAAADRDEAENARILTEAASDKALILDGITAILAHVKECGYDLTPYLDENECKEIFADDDGVSTVPLTVSMTTVFTTLVYFRRGYKRKNLFAGEFAERADALMPDVVAVLATIMMTFTEYVERNSYVGWGFTPKSRATTLSDTYAVVDAISRFEDAFRKKETYKRDDEFVDLVNRYAHSLGSVAIVDRCVNSVYKVAFNVYDRTKHVYGKSIFFSSSARGRDDTVEYSYSRTDYEQISNSTRSSALFNPLYVAMITMYGYNEKELVIRRLMDDYDLAEDYYERFELKLAAENEGLDPADRQLTVSEYAREFPEVDFEEDVKLLLEKNHARRSDDYSDNTVWRKYYNIARVFQKYLETQQNEELMRIPEYRDYLNATKDAIDQVQLMYRNFDNNQRLGIIDTDYVMFSQLDINTDTASISKLNKANISVNNLRPMLLSSKIMIVNALTRYPQADLENLYDAIIEAQYKTRVGKSNGWLWNADAIDMNSTARHCEAIAYDYFDYYERYELGLKAITSLKESIGSQVKTSVEKQLKDGDEAVDFKGLMQSDPTMVGFKRVVLDITRQNVELVKGVYQDDLRKADLAYARTITDLKNELEEEKKKQAELEREKEEALAALERKNRENLSLLEHSLTIGDTMRAWIREETASYLCDTLAMIVLNKLNGHSVKDRFSVRSMMTREEDGSLFSAGFAEVKALAEKIKEDYAASPEKAAETYEPAFREAIGLQKLFEGAFNGVLDLLSIQNELISNRSFATREQNVQNMYTDTLHSRSVEEGSVRRDSGDETK